MLLTCGGDAPQANHAVMGSMWPPRMGVQSIQEAAAFFTPQARGGVLPPSVSVAVAQAGAAESGYLHGQLWLVHLQAGALFKSGLVDAADPLHGDQAIDHPSVILREGVLMSGMVSAMACIRYCFWVVRSRFDSAEAGH